MNQVAERRGFDEDTGPVPSAFSVDLTTLKWGKFHAWASLLRVPAIVAALVLGHCFHQQPAGVLAGGAALSCGFASLRQVRGSRFLAMVWTAAAMALSAWVGTLVGFAHWSALLATAFWGFGCGLLVVFSDDLGWIAMQATIALLIATAFPNHGLMAAERSAAILAGSGLQIGLLLILWRLLGISRLGSEFPDPGVPVPPLVSFAEAWRQFRASWVFTSTAFHYALRVALTLMIAIEAERLMSLKNGYWLPMTTLVVLKPDFYRTYTGGVQRVIGTLAGVIVASVIAMVLRPQAEALILLVGLFGLWTYSFQNVNAVVFSLMLTSYAVFLIALTGLPEGQVTVHRLVNTVLGCALAMSSRFIGFSILRRGTKRLVPPEAAP